MRLGSVCLEKQIRITSTRLEMQVWKCMFGNASLKIQVSKRNVSVEMMWKYCTLEKSS